MTTRALRTTELTPDARMARAKRLFAEAAAEMVEACVAKGVVASEWVDQDASPLGRGRHLRLVREHVLRGVREGRKVLVKRSDINAYLEQRCEARPVEDEDDVEGIMAAALKAVGAGGRSR